MRLFQTIGVEHPLPGSGAFQSTFVVASHWTGYETLSLLPLSRGPRQCGQFAFVSASAALEAKAAKIESRRGERGNMRSIQRRESEKDNQTSTASATESRLQ